MVIDLIAGYFEMVANKRESFQSKKPPAGYTSRRLFARNGRRSSLYANMLDICRSSNISVMAASGVRAW